MKSSAPLDLVASVRLMLALFWHQFAPIVILGFVFLTIPAVAIRLADVSGSGNPSLGTAVQTLRWLLVMIFLSAVTGGVLARTSDPRTFIRAGLSRIQPGLIVALIIGTALMCLRIALLLAGRFLPLGEMNALLFVIACIAVFALWVLAIPVALGEGGWPLAALKRSADLTRGNRGRLSLLFMGIMLVLTPPIIAIRHVIFRNAETPHQVAEIVRSMTLGSPALWIVQLSTLLVYALLSVVPVALYLMLARRT